MNAFPDGGEGPPSLSHELSPEEVTMDLTMCGLLSERAEEIAQLYRDHGTWNEVKDVWFGERRSNRSTRGSSQKIYRVLSSRFKNAPTSLPNPSSLPALFERCSTTREKAQILFLYLVSDDMLVRYTVHEYVQRLQEGRPDALDFADETLIDVLSRLEYSDGTRFDYAESTTQRWCEGFRSVMRDIGVLEDQQAVSGSVPTLDDRALLVGLGHSYEKRDDTWIGSPIGLQYLFQPETRWEELYDRAVQTGAWEFVELQGSRKLQPTDETYAWIDTGGDDT